MKKINKSNLGTTGLRATF